MKKNNVPLTTIEMSNADTHTPAIPVYDQKVIPAADNYYPDFSNQISHILDETVEAIISDRMNTKRAISAEIASNARVQNQNDRLITICEKELLRKDLSEERRAELIHEIRKAVNSSAESAASSRSFINKGLNHSHKQHWKILVFAIVVIGGVALRRTA